MSKIVFTNGCFDLIHRGHVELLEKARSLGDRLVVGINSDESVRRIKGQLRPITKQEDRAAVLIALSSVDEVRVFNEPTPENLIKSVRPDVLVKGGDWKKSEIIGADFVESNGGSVATIPLTDGYSTTSIIDRFGVADSESEGTGEGGLIGDALAEHSKVIADLGGVQAEDVSRCGKMIVDCLTNGGKILICGNGGSAADAQHIAAEIVGRYESDRRSLPAIALTTDTSSLTAISNDFSFENVFARQVEGLASEGDLLVGISTSGNSPNVNKAVMAARKLGCSTVGLTGGAGTKLAGLCDAAILVSSERTARIQEAHITIGHIWCSMVDAAFEDRSDD